MTTQPKRQETIRRILNRIGARGKITRKDGKMMIVMQWYEFTKHQADLNKWFTIANLAGGVVTLEEKQFGVQTTQPNANIQT